MPLISLKEAMTPHVTTLAGAGVPPSVRVGRLLLLQVLLQRQGRWLLMNVSKTFSVRGKTHFIGIVFCSLLM